MLSKQIKIKNLTITFKIIKDKDIYLIPTLIFCRDKLEFLKGFAIGFAYLKWMLYISFIRKDEC